MNETSFFHKLPAWAIGIGVVVIFIIIYFVWYFGGQPKPLLDSEDVDVVSERQFEALQNERLKTSGENREALTQEDIEAQIRALQKLRGPSDGTETNVAEDVAALEKLRTSTKNTK